MRVLNVDQMKEVENELLRRDYYYYVEFVHNGRYFKGKAPKFICETVQEFIEEETGNAYDILILDLPPQHGKSMSITETLPSWYLGKYPMNRVIQASYNQEFAGLFCTRNREKIKEYGKRIFGIEIGTKDTQEEFNLTNGVGGMISRGLMTGITGRGANLVIIDDPIKNSEEADSPTMRQKIFNEWMFSIKTRLAVGAKIIIIMTRWHKEDLAGMVAKEERHVRLINIPVECIDPATDPLHRELGDALLPETGKDRKWLQDFKQDYLTTKGSRAWNALFMGSPTTEEGGIFKRAWFKFYTELPKLAFLAISVDATFKDMESSDYVAIHVWGKIGTRFYLVYRFKKIMGFVETCSQLERVIREHPHYNAIYVEDKANGSAIIDTLSRKYNAIIPIQPEGGKLARANAVSPIAEAGNVYVRDSDYEYINEMCDFPFSDHDDEVDCSTQAWNKMRDIVADFPEEKDPYVLDYEDETNNVLSYGG